MEILRAGLILDPPLDWTLGFAGLKPLGLKRLLRK